MTHKLRIVALACVLLVVPTSGIAADVFHRVRDGYADSGGVKIHYVSLGRGPLLVMIHGFPDFWYGWRDQIAALAHRYQVVALDLRGYNLSDKPRGVEQYDLALVAGDVAAVIRASAASGRPSSDTTGAAGSRGSSRSSIRR